MARFYFDKYCRVACGHWMNYHGFRSLQQACNIENETGTSGTDPVHPPPSCKWFGPISGWFLKSARRDWSSYWKRNIGLSFCSWIKACAPQFWTMNVGGVCRLETPNGLCCNVSLDCPNICLHHIPIKARVNDKDSICRRHGDRWEPNKTRNCRLREWSEGMKSIWRRCHPPFECFQLNSRPPAVTSTS